MADVVSAFLWDTEFMGQGIWKVVDPQNPPPEFLRSLAEPDVKLGDCGTLPTWCPHCDSPQAPHCPGLALGGAFWDLRKQLMRCNTAAGTPSCTTDADCPAGASCTLDIDTERLFSDFLFVTDGRLDPSILAEVLAADDTDGNLCNDSPHKQAIIDAFELHGWTWDNDASCAGGAGAALLLLRNRLRSRFSWRAKRWIQSSIGVA